MSAEVSVWKIMMSCFQSFVLAEKGVLLTGSVVITGRDEGEDEMFSVDIVVCGVVSLFIKETEMVGYKRGCLMCTEGRIQNPKKILDI